MAPVVKLVRLNVQGASQKSVTGAKNWVALQAKEGEVVIEATTEPNNVEQEWKQIRWSGDAASPPHGKPNRRAVPLGTSKKYHVEATLGGVTDAVDVWILSATVTIQTKGQRPTNAAKFDPGSRDNTENLGAVTYKSMSSSVVDESAGVFVDNMGASGKVAPFAKLSPRGVGQVVADGWTFHREIQFITWVDGVAAEESTPTWRRDTSNAKYLHLKPDSDDTIYDLDAPDIRWGSKTYETYNNFRQWVEWNGVRCSDYALWYWQAQWKVDKDPKKQILLNDLGAGKNITLPNKPSFPPAKK